ncbi:membrane protein [Paenibacillus sp. CCS19]|uniref:DUF2500 domain-containing protein n=1 Tax=Paenibacillus sp. CCS19 TaxID=3158387 RepID=UPI00256AECBF|nr:DUF2500 domain-containing protein [Paenibacillus cellulosilyticus]GMK39577.1 membrane protein [Paenibacillus cellulosilyticus]
MNNYGEPNGFFDFLDEIPLFFKLFGGTLFIIVVGAFGYVIIKGLSGWASNNAAQIMTKRCKVTDKRTEVWGGSGESSANTSYYITFEFEDHSRIELPIRDNQFGLISVGDQGNLTYQGTRFKAFNRDL